MRILVACEESQSVTKEFRLLGHEAYSCDIQECSGGHPEWHFRTDVFELINESWDMIIAFPPCTHLAVSGARHFDKKRLDGRQREGIEFFAKILNAPCDKIAVENPVGIISGDYITKWFPDLAIKYDLPRKPSQIIQPWMFGDEAQKSTCLWLKGLPLLNPTSIVGKGEFYTTPSGKRLPTWYNTPVCDPGANRQKMRSKTFPGIAKAMATQWSVVSIDTVDDLNIDLNQIYEGVF